MELLRLMLSCQYNQICFLTNHCGINLLYVRTKKKNNLWKNEAQVVLKFESSLV